MAVLQYSYLTPCRNCQYEVRYLRDIENAATPVANNWLCPNCGHRDPASQHRAWTAGYSMATPSTEVGTTLAIGDSGLSQATPYSLATPDLGGYNSVIKPS